MPNQGESVIVWTTTGMCIAAICGKTITGSQPTWIETNGESDFWNVTHWIPLPEPPKDNTMKIAFMAKGNHSRPIQVEVTEDICFECKHKTKILTFGSSGNTNVMRFCISCLQDFHDGKISNSKRTLVSINMEYVKINSLWKRQDYVKGLPKGSHGPLIVGQHSEPEFANIKKWRVDEKIDGTNIRIFYEGGDVRFGGRTKDAQLPCHLLEYLQNTFDKSKLSEVFSSKNDIFPNVILFGEGYGPKIQACGSSYRKEVGFILFDVVIDGWWLTREDVKEIGTKLNIPTVPDLGLMTEEEIIEFVKSKPLSRCSQVPQIMEGIVARSEPLMLFRNGKPLMWKLKCKEFL